MDDVLVKLIIPAIFLVFWVLNQLFGRENKAAPNPAMGQPLGPRPPVRPPVPRPAEAPVARDPTLRWPGSAATERVPSRDPMAARDDFLVIRPEPAPRSSAPGPTGGSAPGRRPQRPKAPATAQRAELVKAKSASGPGSLVAAADAQTVPPQTTAGARTTGSGDASVPSVSALLLAARSPAQLREAIVLNELLQPPLALRPRRRR